MWLVAAVTGDLADAVTRDLLADRLDFDDLGWRGLWAYVTAAPPGTAIHYARHDGWTVADHMSAELLSDVRELLWRYTCIHFEGGKDLPFPQRIPHPGVQAPAPVLTWDDIDSIEDLISPEVRELLK